jgi:hypothetical protein
MVKIFQNVRGFEHTSFKRKILLPLTGFEEEIVSEFLNGYCQRKKTRI